MRSVRTPRKPVPVRTSSAVRYRWNRALPTIQNVIATLPTLETSCKRAWEVYTCKQAGQFWYGFMSNKSALRVTERFYAVLLNGKALAATMILLRKNRRIGFRGNNTPGNISPWSFLSSHSMLPVLAPTVWLIFFKPLLIHKALHACHITRMCVMVQ